MAQLAPLLFININMQAITFLHEKIKKQNFISQFLIFLILSYAATILIIPFLQNAGPTGGRDLTVLNIGGKGRNIFILFAILLSPLIETFIFQWLIYEQLRVFSFFKNRVYLIVLISGAIFGIIHNFSIEYQLFAFSLGCYLCFTYHYFKTYSKSAFLAIFLIHSFRNLIAVLGQLYLKN